jgi:hypothetical protein
VSFATAGDYVPQAASDWRTEAVDLSAFVGEKIRLRFVSKNQYGNDLYLDNVTVDNQPLGLMMAPPAEDALRLYPNPAHDVVRLTGAPGATATVLDGCGRVVRTIALPDGTTALDVRGLPVGVYAVRVGAATRRLVVE